jgi:iron complex outermembrane recepter protein
MVDSVTAATLEASTHRAPRLSARLAAALALTAPLAAAAQQAPAPADGADAGLNEIVVTAQKRSEALSKAPLAVSALSQDQLTAAGVVGLEDLTSSVPNVEIKTVTFVNAIQVTIRGITNSDFNPGDSPAVATYIDGVYIPRTQGLNGDLYDIERVEVLRGPQGTLYGRNATGGNINVITPDPAHTFGAAADMSYGNYNDVQTHGMVNLPLTDTLAVRLAVATHRSDGYIDTQESIGRNYAADDDFSGRFTALWTPSEQFRWRIAVEDSVQNGTAGADYETAPNGAPLDGLPVYSRPAPDTVQPQKYIDNFTVRSRMEFHLTDAWTLSYLAGYEDLKFQSVFAILGDGTSTPFDGHRTAASKSYSQELNLSFDGESLKNILGASFTHEDEYDFDAYRLYTPGTEIGYRGGTSLGPSARDDAAGVFDQATYTIIPTLRAIAGVRYSSESKGNALNGFGQEYCPLTVSLQEMLSQQHLPGCTISTEGGVYGHWSNTNWKAGLEYDVSDRILSYATVTTGFKAGGLNIGGTDLQPEAFSPEKVTNYEVGTKGRFLDNRLNVYSDIFYMDYTNLQVTQLSGVANVTDNAARATIYGLELESQAQLTSSDRLSGFFDYLHATYGKYQNAVDQQTGIIYPSLAGNYLTNAPEYSAKLSYSHQFALPNGAAITPSASEYFQSLSYLREFNLPIDRVGGYGKTNMSLEYSDSTERWKVTAYVDNLTDRIVRNGGYTVIGTYESDYYPPRLYGLRVAYKY